MIVYVHNPMHPTQVCVHKGMSSRQPGSILWESPAAQTHDGGKHVGVADVVGLTQLPKPLRVACVIHCWLRVGAERVLQDVPDADVAFVSWSVRMVEAVCIGRAFLHARMHREMSSDQRLTWNWTVEPQSTRPFWTKNCWASAPCRIDHCWALTVNHILIATRLRAPEAEMPVTTEQPLAFPVPVMAMAGFRACAARPWEAA